MDDKSILYKMMTDPILQKEVGQPQEESESELSDGTNVESLMRQTPSKNKQRKAGYASSSIYKSESQSASPRPAGSVLEHEFDLKKVHKFQKQITKNLNVELPDQTLGKEDGKMGRVDISQNTLTFFPELLEDAEAGDDPLRSARELIDNIIIRNNSQKQTLSLFIMNIHVMFNSDELKLQNKFTGLINGKAKIDFRQISLKVDAKYEIYDGDQIWIKDIANCNLEVP